MDFVVEEELYRKYADELIRYATVLIGPDRAGDAVADALVGALQGGRLRDARHPKAYLYRSVHNAATAIATRATKRERREIEDGITARPHYWPADVDLDVIQAVARLSPRQRAVIYLTYWDDQTPQAIADILEISEGSVKQHLTRARRAVRRALR